ncbi:MAG: phage terminase large subunit family protein [Edaphocola sp.]
MKIAIKAGLKPEPRLSVSEWADQNRVLDSVSSAEAGRYRTSRTPFLREIMDNLTEYSDVEEVIVAKGAQLGVTEAGLNWIGYTIDISPCPMLFVEPTKEVMELVSKTRVQPMMENTPGLATKVKPARSRDSGNTLTKKEFPGGVLRMAGANSAAGLRNMPVKRLVLDEVDAYPLDLDGEGNPVDLARKRTATFSKRKIFILSTPTVKGLSLIERLFENTDQRYYHVPCPHCGAMQPLVWEQLRYDYDKSAKSVANVRYECAHCNAGIDESHKTTMLGKGQWIATQPHNANRKKVGYHINSMYSPKGWFGWADMADEWEAAQGDEPKMKTFYNVNLGLAYEARGDKPDWEALYNRRGGYAPNTIPTDDIAFLTAGVDVQKDRIELEIVGWCEGKTSWSIDYRVLRGYTAGDGAEVWRQLSSVLDETWEKPSGAQMQVRLMCVDSGYNTSEVYSFCHAHSTGRVVPTKGKDEQPTIVSAPKAVNVTRKNKPIGQTKVWHVGVSVLKAELYGWLRLEEGAGGFCHFPQYGEEYFKGITAEELVVTKNARGQDVQAWKKKYQRNEPLDTRIYARAAAHMLGMDVMKPAQWTAWRGSTVQAVPDRNKPKRKSDYWK